MQIKDQTCLENLNNTLVQLAKNNEKIVFIGEDIKEPYGGAFKVEKGLSEMFPDRVISTPISEESFMGFAAGLSMRGYIPIVDLMFSDFMTLSMDMVINFISKYPQMYGRPLPLKMVIRSANGGYRGYGATHSQSMQKFFLGIPNVYVYEMSPFHDNQKVFNTMFLKNKACIFFEEKLMYGVKMNTNSPNKLFNTQYMGENDNWAHLYMESKNPDITIICSGGMSKMCLNAGEKLLLDYEIETEIFVPSQLYPCEISDILKHINNSKNILVVEESTAGATWGSHVLEMINNLSDDFNSLKKVKLLSSDDYVIPSYKNFENNILINEEKITTTILDIIKQNDLLS